MRYEVERPPRYLIPHTSYLHRQVRLLTLFSFCSSLRFGSVLLAIYFAAVSGSYTLGMSIFSIASMAQLMFEAPAGVYSDRVGRRTTVIAGSVLSLGFTTCFAIGQGYGWLVAGAVIEGLARAMYSGNNDALLYETLVEAGEPERYAEYAGKIRASEPVAFGLAGLAGGVIAVRSLSLPFWLTLIPQALALALAFGLHEPRLSQRDTRERGQLRRAARLFLANPRLRLLTLGAALREGLGEASHQFDMTFVRSLWPAWALGIAGLVNNVAGALGFYLSGRVVGRWGALPVMVGNVLVGRILNLTALLAPTVASPVLMSLTGLGYGASMVASSALQQREFSPDQRATMGSLVAVAENIAFAAGALGIGLLADWLGVIPALVLPQCVMVTVAAVYQRLYHHPPRPIDPGACAGNDHSRGGAS